MLKIFVASAILPPNYFILEPTWIYLSASPTSLAAWPLQGLGLGLGAGPPFMEAYPTHPRAHPQAWR